MRWPISRVLSRTIIHLGLTSPQAFSGLPEPNASSIDGVPIWPCSEWGLHCHELLPVARCALTAPFHPYQTYIRNNDQERNWRYIFCCTSRRLAPPRRYLAPCSVEPGLSSLCICKARLSGHL